MSSRRYSVSVAAQSLPAKATCEAGRFASSLASLVFCLALAALFWATANRAHAQTPAPPVQRVTHNGAAPAVSLATASAGKKPALHRPPDGGVLYNNGPTNGTNDAWTINFGFEVSDSFPVNSVSMVTGMSFAAWLMPGDLLQTVDVSITSSEFGGTTYFNGTVNFVQNDCNANQYGFNVCIETGDFPTPLLMPGTYWVNLQNAVVNNGDPIEWDENDGPSSASENSIGTIPSESFTMLGNTPVPTETSLTVSPNPATAGQVVTLTATTLANTEIVDVGTVTFLNGTQVLATVGANSSGVSTAILETRLGPGTYAITAQYNGNGLFQSSQSTPTTLIVTGTEPTISTLTATPEGNDYNFGLSVFGFGFPPPAGPALAGSATLNNLTQGGMLLGTIPVSGQEMPSFRPPQSFATGTNPARIIVGDFNNDGIPDLAVTNFGDNTVSILLGNGDGTFQTQTPYATAPGGPVGIVAWDLNGDGNLDLLAAIQGTEGSNGPISLLLGNGDGTFRQQMAIPLQFNFLLKELALADYNLDGDADLAVTGEAGVTILLGNGDIGFEELEPIHLQFAPQGIATGDFNGDGVPDLVVTAGDESQVLTILLGNGDGTFNVGAMPQVGNGAFEVATGHFTTSGNLDLATANQADGKVSVLLGEGNGTFQPQVTYLVCSDPYSIVVADFNGDGNADLAVTCGDGSLDVLLGNGDGTFQAAQNYSGNGAVGLAVGDFNGDGVPDLADTGNNTTGVFLGGTLSAGALNNISVAGTGDQNIQANFAPTGTFYTGSLSNIVTVVGNGQIPTTTTLTSSANPSPFQRPVTFTARVTWNDGVASGVVTFQSNGSPIPECPNPITLVNGVATCTTTSLTAGSDTILASFSDPTGIYASSSATLIQTVQTVGDFQISVTPGSLTVTQGYSNATDPFFSHPVTVTVQALNGYNNTVSLSCSLSPAPSGGSCVVNSPSSGVVDGNLNSTLTITTTAGTPIGNYMIIVTGRDNNGLMHQSSPMLTVIQQCGGITEPSGGGGSCMVMFPGNPGAPFMNPSCPLVTGTGLSGSQPLSMIGGNCAFTPTSGTIPGPVMVTISGCMVARLRSHLPIYASLFLGLPGWVLVGSLSGGRRRRRRLSPIIFIALILAAMLLGVACGGYGQLTPTGNYQVLVQATGPDGTVYSAVVPVTVTPLK